MFGGRLSTCLLQSQLPPRDHRIQRASSRHFRSSQDLNVLQKHIGAQTNQQARRRRTLRLVQRGVAKGGANRQKYLATRNLHSSIHPTILESHKRNTNRHAGRASYPYFRFPRHHCFCAVARRLQARYRARWPTECASPPNPWRLMRVGWGTYSARSGGPTQDRYHYTRLVNTFGPVGGGDSGAPKPCARHGPSANDDIDWCSGEG
jgi:hypothetical protein